MKQFSLSLITVAFLSQIAICQNKNTEQISHFGFESELMCWINSGYYFSAWYGKNSIRSRAVIAKATYPDAFNPEGFTGLTSTFYEMEFDFYFGKKKNMFRGLWLAGGPGYTIQSIESIESGKTGRINLFDIHSGIGYAISIYKGFYVNPWVGVDLHINTKDVLVGDEIWAPNFIDPVLGMKLGYSF